MLFYLGTHQTNWLDFAPFPLFVSDRRLRVRVRLPRAASRWALDSGGFTELSMHGRWETSPQEYVERVNRYHEEIGKLDWAAPQDWMCEPQIREKTGLTVEQHQARTIENYHELRALAPHISFTPVLQGWVLDDYLRHVEMYAASGVDLFSAPVVGVGTVCRRQATAEGVEIIRTLAGLGLRLHAFGFKRLGLRKCASMLASSDSLAWSFRARRSEPLPGCTHKSCANCFKFADKWRTETLKLGRDIL
jgi:hypothetical protein